jgi:hypothetical protein
MKWLRNSLRSPNSIQDKNDGFIILKFLGIGSITRIISTLRDEGVNLDKGILCTFSSNKELCDLLEVPNVIYLNPENPLQLMRSLFNIVNRLRINKMGWIIDMERSSNCVGILREVLCLMGYQQSISFKSGGKGIRSKTGIEFNLDQSFNQLIFNCIPYLPIGEKISNTVQKSSKKNQIIININASDYLSARRYPQNQFIYIINELLDSNPEMKIHLVGSKDENEYVQTIFLKIDKVKQVQNQCGKWSLNRLFEEIEQSILFITNDSGPMHLGKLTNTKMIVIWGPTSPDNFGYLHNINIHNITSNLPCSPCFVEPKSKPCQACNHNVDCMVQLNPQIICKLAFEIMEEETKYKALA